MKEYAERSQANVDLKQQPESGCLFAVRLHSVTEMAVLVQGEDI